MKRTQQTSTLFPMMIIGGLFFVFGFVTWLNGALIPFLQIACQLSHFEAYMVTLSFYIAYTVFALPMSLLLKRTGYKRGMAFGLVAMAIGALVFIPAAQTRLFSVFLIGLFILGAGLTALQAASNPYVVLIGARNTAAVRVSILGILNKAAGVVAPLVFTALVFSDMSGYSDDVLAALSPAELENSLAELANRLVRPYVIMAALLGLVAFLMFVLPLPEPDFRSQPGSSDQASVSILRRPQLILGAVALFCYVGVEVIAGDTIGLFGKGLGVGGFGQLTAYTMSFMVLGYVVGIITIPRLLSQSQALSISAILGLLFATLLLQSSTVDTSLWHALFAWTGASAVPNAVLFVALLGLANALVWPAVWPLALQDLSVSQISTGSALLIMGIAGGAILPLGYGALADRSGNSQLAYWIVIPCYLFIAFYALKGHRLRQWPLTGK